MNYGAQKSMALLLSLSLLSASCAGNRATDAYNIPLMIANKKNFVEIAKTEKQLTRGLSGRDKLKADEGMLFVFTSPGHYGFWMKEMKFDLDLIWIKDKKIIGITAKVSAPVKDKGLRIKDNELPVYYPPSGVDLVLEVNAGWSERNGVKIGDEVRF